MATGHRLGETNLSESGPSSSNHNIPNPYGFNLHGYNPSVPNPFMNQGGGGGGSAFDFGELEEAIVLQSLHKTTTTTTTGTTTTLHGSYGGGHDESKPPPSALYTGRPAATLDMFPSWPIRFQQPDTTPRLGSSKSGGGEGGGEESTDSGSAVNTTFSSKAAAADHLEQESSPISRKAPPPSLNQQQQYTDMAATHHHQHASTKSGTGTGTSQLIASKQPLLLEDNNNNNKRQEVGARSEKVLDAKTLRRLAQNREAAKKSRLRKKAYVQQLESSRIKLAQLEQELQRARAQGLFMGGGGGTPSNISSGAAIFDMEYGRWLEDDHRHMSELRTGLQAHLPDGDLRVIVDGYINHYDEIFRLKGVAAKTDVFHLITGMWTTPAERCFLWMGGFRPSELIKMLIGQLDLLTEQQLMGIYSLQHSSQQAEEALTQGLDQLQQSLVDTIATTTTFADGRHQMAVALGKLSNLEGFIRQADNLRQQTLHQLRRILTIRQAARCFIVIGEYYGRLRALSSLWASRPRDQSMMNEDNSCQVTTGLQMVQQQQQPPSQNQFVNF